MELLTNGRGEWNSTKNNLFESISRGSLIEEAKVWFYFIGSVLLYSKHLSIVRQEEAILLYAILKGYKINVGKDIENSIMNYYRSKYIGLMPHPVTITRLRNRKLLKGKSFKTSKASNQVSKRKQEKLKLFCLWLSDLNNVVTVP